MAFRKLICTFPDKYTEDMWHELNRRIKEGFDAAGETRWENFVFVGKDGNDGTGTRNSLTNKFLTVQAALNAAQAGDTVFVGPGVYTENIVWPATNNLTLTGKFGFHTQIVGAGGAPTVDIAGTHNLQGVMIADIWVQSVVAGFPAISVDGSSVAGYTMFEEQAPFVAWRSVIANTAGGPSCAFLRSGTHLFFDCILLDGDVLITDCDEVTLTQSTGETNIVCSYQEANAHPANAAGEVRFLHSQFQDVLLNHQAVLYATNSDLEAITTGQGSLDDHLLPYHKGEVRLHNCKVENLDLSCGYAFGAPPIYAVHAYQTSFQQLCRVVNAGEFVPYGLFRNCDFQTLTADGSNLDCNQCFLNQSGTSAPNNGAIDRDFWFIGLIPIAPSPGAPVPYATPNNVPYINNSLVQPVCTPVAAGGTVECAAVSQFAATLGSSVAGVPVAAPAYVTMIQSK